MSRLEHERAGHRHGVQFPQYLPSELLHLPSFNEGAEDLIEASPCPGLPVYRFKAVKSGPFTGQTHRVYWSTSPPQSVLIQPSTECTGTPPLPHRVYWSSPPQSVLVHRLYWCSSGFDRHRQDWVDNSCPDETKDKSCDIILTTPRPVVTTTTVVRTTSRSQETDAGLGVRSSTHTPTSVPTEDDTKIAVHLKEPGDGRSENTLPAARADGAAPRVSPGTRPLHTGLILAVVVVMVVLVAGLVLSLYVYHHPTSTTGLFFIERRPRRWPAMKFYRRSGRPAYAEVEPTGLGKDVFMDPDQF
ncbi:unnamed protein product [Boreogadus saida]